MTDTSNLRNQLAERARPVAPYEDQPKPLAVVVKEAIDRQADAFRAVLPAHVDANRFHRLTLVAIKANPKLLNAFTTRQGQQSVLLACMQAAALGLEPNTPTQQCWLTPRRVKDQRGNWVDEAELTIGYRGLIKLVRKTDNLKTIFAVVVRKNDHFRWGRGLEEDYLEHTPADDGDDNDDNITHCYAVARYKDGGYDFLVMNRAQLERRRAMSPAWQSDVKFQKSASPWSNWFAEQCQKTVLRRLIATMDVDPAVALAASVDEARFQLGADGVETIEAGHVPAEIEPPPSNVDPIEGRTMLPPAPDPQPVENEAQPVDDEPAQVAEPKMSQDQSRKLFAMLREAEITTKEDRLTWASATLEREVASFGDLTKAQGSLLIDHAKTLDGVELPDVVLRPAGDTGQ